LTGPIRVPLSPEEQLDQVLAEDRASVVQRERCASDRLLESCRSRLVLHGAGRLGRRILAGLRQLGVQPLAFSDNNSALWGRRLDELPVLAPAEAARAYGDSALFMVSIWRAQGSDRMADRFAQLRELGCRHLATFLPLFVQHPDLFLPHYMLDLPHRICEQAPAIRRAFSLLADRPSQREFVNHLHFHLSSDFDHLSAPIRDLPYFPTDLFTAPRDETFIDCGAFDGDTVYSLLRVGARAFRQIIAIEPDPTNCARLSQSLSTLPEDFGRKVVVKQSAVGSERTRVRFNNSGTAASGVSPDGAIEVDSAPLDELLADCAPTYIKMDIEGSEVDALRGASATIKRRRPILGICVYHRQEHLWEVPLLIHSLGEGYSFFLRPHDYDGWDTVCYAVPRSRLLPR
jgi:FkbM family methyltransferase